MLTRVKFIPSMFDKASVKIVSPNGNMCLKLGMCYLLNDKISEVVERLQRSLVWSYFYSVGDSHAEDAIFGSTGYAVSEEVTIEEYGVKSIVRVSISIPYLCERDVVSGLNSVYSKGVSVPEGVEIVAGDVDSYNRFLESVESQFIPF